jgi:hypothetical protein
MARVCSVLANTHSSGTTFKLEDFLFRFGKEREQTVEEMKAQLLGTVGRGDK